MTRAEVLKKLRRKFKQYQNQVARRFGSTAYEYFTMNGKLIQIEHRRTEADLGTIGQCFRRAQYDFPYAVGAFCDIPGRVYEAIVRSARKPLIIDGGSNIGASVLWFAAKYPEAHVVAVEPAPDNCVLLSRNLRHLDVDIRSAGIGATEGFSVVVDAGLGEWGYRTEASGTGPKVPMLTLNSILREKSPELFVPFILKLDIEGSEKGLFDEMPNSAGHFPSIILETHDWMLPTSSSSESFFRFHLSKRRDFTQHGENAFSTDYAMIKQLYPELFKTN